MDASLAKLPKYDPNVATLHLLMTPRSKQDAKNWVQPRDTVVVFDQDELLDLKCSAQYLANFTTQATTPHHISTEKLAGLISRFHRVESW